MKEELSKDRDVASGQKCGDYLAKELMRNQESHVEQVSYFKNGEDCFMVDCPLDGNIFGAVAKIVRTSC